MWILIFLMALLNLPASAADAIFNWDAVAPISGDTPTYRVRCVEGSTFTEVGGLVAYTAAGLTVTSATWSDVEIGTYACALKVDSSVDDDFDSLYTDPLLLVVDREAFAEPGNFSVTVTP